jgi:hypothetical protein
LRRLILSINAHFKTEKLYPANCKITNENNSRHSCPLRFHRFPAKLMQDLGGKTVILRTYEAAVNTKLFDDVL